MSPHNQLIIDAGGSSTTWAVVNAQEKIHQVVTEGFSPIHQFEEDLLALIQTAELQQFAVDHIFYYGAGISSPSHQELVQNALYKAFPKATIEVHSDLLAAAHATSGRQEGISCILGTGSNVCFFDGKEIVLRHHSLGYILGDEGSGADLGKRVLQYYFYNTFDDTLKKSFEKTFDADINNVLERTYKGHNANRYLANFAQFLAQHRGHYMVENILEDAFLDFLNAQVLKYRESWTHPIHYIGSIAYEFNDVLTSLHETMGLQLGTVLKDPIDGLIPYYQQKIKAQDE